MEEEYFHEVGAKIEGAVCSKMFGKLCYKIGEKAFCSYYENSMVFKLQGEFHQEALVLAGSKLFDPSGKGRAMKEWVQVSFSHKTYWNTFAKAAAEYVENL